MGGEEQAVVVEGEKVAVTATAVEWHKWLKPACTLLAAVIITVGVFILRDQIKPFANFGYPGVFIFSILGSATIFIPAPGYAIVLAAAVFLNPLLVGIIAGLGAALGELTGYLAGTTGQSAVTNREAFRRLEPWIRRYNVFAIALLAAIPNPLFDVAGILSGMLRIPAWQFVLAAWVGKSIRFILLAYGVALSLPFLDKL